MYCDRITAQKIFLAITSFLPIIEFCQTPFLGPATSINMRDASRVIKLHPQADENFALVSSGYVSSMNAMKAAIQAKA
jgi:hypothetical protein